MPHFAQIGKFIGDLAPVLNVTEASVDFIQSGVVGDPNSWIETDPHTYGNTTTKEGAQPVRKNYAGVGYTYNRKMDTFSPPKPVEFSSFIKDEDTCLWIPPVTKPNDGQKYQWDEAAVNWVVSK